MSGFKGQRPSLLYGTAWKKERTADLVFEAIQQGFRGVDTACQPRHYQEALVGQGIARAMESLSVQRSDLFIQTKFTPPTGQDEASTPYDRNDSITDQVARSITVSQENLNCKFIDSLVLHSPYPDGDDLMEAWSSLEKAVDEGVVGQIGISNCYDVDVFTRLFEKAKIKPKVLQNRFYQDSGYDVSLRRFCRQHDVMYQSFWTLTANPHILNHRLMKDLCDELSATPAQVLFRYLIDQGCQPLTGTTSQLHMQEDLLAHKLDLKVEHGLKLESIAPMAL